MSKIKLFFKKFFDRTDITGLSILGHGHHFDWKFLITSFFIVILGVLLFSTQVFLGVRAGSLFQAKNTSATAPVLINRKGLETILQVYATKAQNFKKLQTDKSVLVDPSR